MKILGTVISAIALFFAVEASSAPDVKLNSRKRQIQENEMLKKQIDSLKQEIEACRAELRLNDSIARQVRDLYEENEDKMGIGINPDDYSAEVSDSLLNLWYLHKKTFDHSEEEYNMDSVVFTSNVPDEVYIDRIKKMNSFITLPYNDIVRNYIILYSEKMPTKMSSILG